jgi:hypothetical protein
MINTVKSSITKLKFKIVKNTLLKDFPDRFKDLFEHALLSDSKTEKLPFLHSKFNELVLPAFVTEEQLRFYSTFKTRPGDVFLITYPKAGTLWLVEIVRRIVMPNNTNTSTVSVKEKLKFVGNAGPLFEVCTHDQLDSLPSPRYMVTHLPLNLIPYDRENQAKYIYLARNPKDLAVSYFYFLRSLPFFDFKGTWEEFLEHFMKGDLPWGSYYDHILEWWSHKNNQNVLFLKYEDLKKDLKGQTKIIGEFLGFHLSDEEAGFVSEKCTFQAMKANPDQAMKNFSKLFKQGAYLRKGIVGDWKNHFSDEQLKQFQKLYESCMNGTGLEFES